MKTWNGIKRLCYQCLICFNYFLGTWSSLKISKFTVVQWEILLNCTSGEYAERSFFGGR